MRKIFYILFSFLSVTVNAQYTDYFKWTDVRSTCIYNMIFADVLIKDLQILTANGVKEVTTRDVSGAVLNTFKLNSQGFITEYSTFEYNDGRKIKYDLTWGDGGGIQKLDYTEEGQYGMHIIYNFSYKNYFVDVISADFGMGLSEDYVLSSVIVPRGSLITKIAYHDRSKDTVYMVCDFQYDSETKLITTKTGADNWLLDTISYEENSVLIEQRAYQKKKYVLEGSRVIEETTTFPTKHHHAYLKPNTIQEKDIVTTKKYFYKENGLIDYITINNSEGKIFYEYGYFN